MIRSLFSGVSGLTTQQLQMDVIGNNISNLNTVGFKSSDMTFYEQFNQLISNAQRSLSGSTRNPMQIGLGVRTGSVDRAFTQGILQNTENPTDLGLQGRGFFVVSDGEREFHTRAGNFGFDNEGRLVTSNGLFVQGWMADASGQLSQGSSLENIELDPNLVFPAIATSNIDIAGNLDASAMRRNEVWTASSAFTLAATGEAATGAADLNDLTQTSTPLVDGDTIVINGTASDGTAVNATFTYGAGNDGTTIDDLLAAINNTYPNATATLENGNIVLTDDTAGDSELAINLSNGATNTGSISLPDFDTTVIGETPDVTTSILVYDSLGTEHTLDVTFTKTENEREWRFQVDAGDEASITQGGSGTLLFAEDGSLQSVTYDQSEAVLTFDPNTGAGPVSMDLNFGADGEDAMTLFVGNSTVNAVDQDGQAAGNLSSFFIDESGQLFGAFSNGENRLIAQIAVSQFNNPSGMIHSGNNIFEATEASGAARIGSAGEDFDTSIHSGVLEASNVDLSEEFTEMIIAQRAFQANARTITVSDQFLNEVVQLKR